MRYLLDTDVISQLSRPGGNLEVIKWVDTHAEENLFLSAVTLLELRFGIELMNPADKRRPATEEFLTVTLPARFAGRIVAVEQHAADLTGRILARSRQLGWNIAPMDALIGASAMANDMGVATLSRKHFERLGVPLAAF